MSDNTVNKGQAGWENKAPQWSGTFSTNRQVVEGISTDRSLEIIDDAERNGIAVRTGGKVYVEQPTLTSQSSANGDKLSLRVRDAQQAENAAKAQGPGANPFLQKNVKTLPPKKNLSDLP